MTWHLDHGTVQDYRDGRLGTVGSASVERHLAACAACRGLVAAQVDAPAAAALARVKAAVDGRLDALAEHRLERALRRLGVGRTDARIVSTGLELAGSWLAASAAVLAFAVAAAATGADRVGFAAFLVLAPLVPMAAVCVAFGRGIDPAHEITVAAPVPTARVVLLRSLAAAGAAVPVLAVLSAALPDLSALAFAWVLPAIALAAAALALATVVPVERAAAALGALWLVGAGVALAGAPRTSPEAFVRAFGAFRPEGQVALLVVAAGCTALASARRVAFEEVR